MSAALLPGDEVVVAAGTYQEQVRVSRGGNADTANGYVILRSATPGAAKLRPTSSTYSTIQVRANYVIVDGFDVQGGSGHAIDAEDCHHVKVVNNITHDSGGSGISFVRSEWITIEDNVAFRNAYTNGYQCSGISIYQARNVTKDTATPGYRVVIRRNQSYANFEFIAGDHTDGNGIIIDDFQSTQTAGFPNYTFPTLVESNLCHSNGGKGIQVTWSDYVSVLNNTCWRNNLDNNNPGTWRAELSNNQSSNNRWINNIGVADAIANRNNSAIGNQSYGGYVNKNVIWHNNLTYAGAAGQASVAVTSGNASPSAQDGNKLGVDPLFVAPAASAFNFRVRAGSPAIGGGTTAFGSGATDLDKQPRVAGAIDIGAYEQTGGTPPPPPPPPSTTSTIWNASVRPALVTVEDARPVELGLKFRTTVGGFITGIRFYKGNRNTGTHTGSLWTASGTKLATAVFANETSSGWQQVSFSQPVPVVAGRTYVASYHTPTGYYSADDNFFVTSVLSGALTALAHGTEGGNGLYAYGAGSFPRSTYRKCNYWVDVTFAA